MSGRNAAERIWTVVAAIPPGRVATYGQVAMLAGQPGRARFVGQAIRAAPARLDLPWFRVIAADGRIALPPGSEARKEQIALLRQEGVTITQDCVDVSTAGWEPDLDELLWGPAALAPDDDASNGEQR